MQHAKTLLLLDIILVGLVVTSATAHKEPVELPSVAVLDVAHGKDRYLFLANSSNEAVQMEVQGLPSIPVTAENLFKLGDMQAVRPSPWKPELEPLQVNAFRLTPTPRSSALE